MECQFQKYARRAVRARLHGMSAAGGGGPATELCAAAAVGVQGRRGDVGGAGAGQEQHPAAISSGRPLLPSGTDAISRGAALPSAALSSVATRPGCSRFTVMPLGARSRAAPRVNPASAAFVPAWSATPGAPARAAIPDPMVMMRPPCGSTCAAARTAATALV